MLLLNALNSTDTKQNALSRDKVFCIINKEEAFFFVVFFFLENIKWTVQEKPLLLIQNEFPTTP